MVFTERENEEIKRDVVDQLYWDDRVDASHIKVEVIDRAARLSGHVPSYTARRAAETDTWLIAGVTSVDNRLEVVNPADTPGPTDADLLAELSTALSWEPSLRDADIDVFVRNGRVTLIGSVDAYWKKLRAEELAATLVGVMDITNELAVVPSQRIEDRLIADSVVAALERNMYVDARAINVRVNEGIVTLSGTVSSLPEFRAVDEIACRTTGIVTINNEVIIE